MEVNEIKQRDLTDKIAESMSEAEPDVIQQPETISEPISEQESESI